MNIEDTAHLVDGKYGITDLVDLEKLRGLFEKFTEATGFTIGFLDHPGLNVLVASGWRDICTKFHRSCPAAEEICVKSNRKLLDNLDEPGQEVIEACDHGLIDCAIPIVVKGKHIASLATGQLLLAPPDIERFKGQAEEHGFDEEAYLAALNEIPVVAPDKLRSITRVLGEIAQVISDMGYVALADKEKTEALTREIRERERAETALEAETANLNAIFESSPVGMFILDETTNIVRANKAIVALCGSNMSEVLHHRPGNALRCVHSAKDPRGCGYAPDCPLCPARRGIEDLIANGGTIGGVELPLQLVRDGESCEVWVEIGAEPFLLRGERHLCVAMTDITERKQIEKARDASLAQIQHLNRILAAIRNVNQLIVRENDPAVLINQACEMLIETRGYNGAWIALGNGIAPPTAFAAAGWDRELAQLRELGKNGRWPRCTEQALACEQSLLIAEPTSECEGCPLATKYDESVPVITALRHGTTTFGLLGVSFPSSIVIDDTERSLLVEVAGDVAFALQDIQERRLRERAEAELQKFKLAAESSTDAIGMSTPDGRHYYQNQAFDDLFGDVGESPADSLYVDKQLGRDVFDALMRGEKWVGACEMYGRQRDVRQIALRAYPIQDQAGNIVALVGVHTDMTEHELAVSETQALLRASQVVLRSSDFETAAEEIFGLCKEQTVATAGFVALRQSENEHKVLFLDSGEADCGVDPALPIPIRGLRAEAYRDNRTVFDNQFSSSAHAELLPDGHAPLRNVMFAPITIAGDVKGIIGLANKDGGFDQEDARRAQALAEIAAIALDRKEHTEALKTSEDQHSKAQKVAHIGHWELDSLTGTPTWSDEIYRIFGLPPQLGAPSFTAHDTIIHPEDLLQLQEAIRAGFEDGRSFELVFRIVRPGDNVGWMRAIGKPHLDGSGKTLKMFGTAQDVSEQKLTMAERDEAQRRLELALQASKIGLWDYFPQENRVVYSDEWKAQLGYAPDEIPNEVEQWSTRIHPGDTDRVAGYLEDFVARGDTGDFAVDFRLRHRDGTYRFIHAQGRARAFENGKVSRLLGCHIDTSERREMEAQLAQADRLSSMGMLAAGVAHEINNPLSYLLYNLESVGEDLPKLLDALRQFQRRLNDKFGAETIEEVSADNAALLNPALLEDMKDRLKDAVGGACRIRDVSRGLGTFSRVEKDQTVPVNLMHVIEVAINMAFNEIKYRARLVKDYGRNLPTVLASEGRLGQVFLNLVINATHAIDEGDLENNEIRVKTWSEGDSVFAQVRDTGSGIPPENLGKLFDAFFTTKKIGVGSGLGLAISKDIVESYGGTIEVESEVGEGTCFTVRLPVQSKEVTEADEVQPVAPETNTRGRILIVDDEDGIRAAMVRMLRGHDTVQVAGGAEAIQILESDQAFDLILCDMMMPNVSGMDLHRWLVDLNPRLAKQLIFITGGAFTPKAREYLSKIDNIRLEKPFDVANFKKIVGELIQSATNRDR